MRRDQAATLRRLARAPRPHQGNETTEIEEAMPQRRMLAVTGGKGGIGKSTISINLAASYARRGSRVLVIDGDLGMADLNMLLGIAPDRSVVDILDGCPIEDVLVEAHGITVLPGLNGSFKAANLDDKGRSIILGAVADLCDRFDTLIVDTAAGIGDTAIGLAGAASEVVVVCNPEPLSLADAYACMKVLAQRTGLRRAYVLPNGVRSPSEAEETIARLQGLTDRFLGIDIVALPPVPYDLQVRSSGAAGVPLVLHQPESPAARAIERIGRRLDQLSRPARRSSVLDRWMASGAELREVSR